jgi:hypothetical protein
VIRALRKLLSYTAYQGKLHIYQKPKVCGAGHTVNWKGIHTKGEEHPDKKGRASVTTWGQKYTCVPGWG